VLKEQRPKYIQFEFNIFQLHRGYSLHDLATLLEGYRFYRLLPRGWVPIDPQKFVNNVYMFSNIIAVCKS